MRWRFTSTAKQISILGICNCTFSTIYCDWVFINFPHFLPFQTTHLSNVFICIYTHNGNQRHNTLKSPHTFPVDFSSTCLYIRGLKYIYAFEISCFHNHAAIESETNPIDRRSSLVDGYKLCRVYRPARNKVQSK